MKFTFAILALILAFSVIANAESDLEKFRNASKDVLAHNGTLAKAFNQSQAQLTFLKGTIYGYSWEEDEARVDPNCTLLIKEFMEYQEKIAVREFIHGWLTAEEIVSNLVWVELPTAIKQLQRCTVHKEYFNNTLYDWQRTNPSESERWQSAWEAAYEASRAGANGSNCSTRNEVSDLFDDVETRMSEEYFAGNITIDEANAISEDAFNNFTIRVQKCLHGTQPNRTKFYEAMFDFLDYNSFANKSWNDLKREYDFLFEAQNHSLVNVSCVNSSGYDFDSMINSSMYAVANGSETIGTIVYEMINVTFPAVIKQVQLCITTRDEQVFDLVVENWKDTHPKESEEIYSNVSVFDDIAKANDADVSKMENFWSRVISEYFYGESRISEIVPKLNDVMINISEAHKSARRRMFRGFADI